MLLLWTNCISLCFIVSLACSPALSSSAWSGDSTPVCASSSPFLYLLWNYLHRILICASTTPNCSLPDANQHLNVKPVIGCCGQPLIDWQAIQPILDVRDCFQVWVCGGKRWPSWCVCLGFSTCMSAATPHLSPGLASPTPRPHLHLSLTFLCCHSLFWSEVAVPPRSRVVLVFYDDIIPAFISDQSAELKLSCQVGLLLYILIYFLFPTKLESWVTIRVLQGGFLMRLFVSYQVILSRKE